MPETTKRLVVCCDGTWNDPEQHHVTNVVRTARALRPTDAQGIPQVVFYDWGVGSYSDKIRGGLLGKIDAHLIPAAYRMYRRRAGPDVPSALKFRRGHSQEVRIRFVGVWDTVGALGIPSQIFEAMGGNRRHAFHDTSLSKFIEHACHALSIDEKRIDFEPTLWKRLPKEGQTIEQQWFAGVHGDVGGGNADAGLADVALDWMWSRAAAQGLAFDDDYRKANVRQNPLGRLHRSWTGMYRVKGRHVRPIGDSPPGLENVHSSVRERFIAMPSYRPDNLKAFLNEHPQIDWTVVPE